MKKLFIIGIYIMVLSSCTSMNVIPTPTTPYFTGENNIEVELGYTTNSIYENFAYALSNNFAFMQSSFFTYNYLSHRKYDSYKQPFGLGPTPLFERNYTYKELYSDIGIGLYKTQNNLFFLLMGGYGIGYSDYQYKYSRDGGREYTSNGVMQRIFIQYNTSYTHNKFNFGGALQFAYANLPLHSVVHNNFVDSTIVDRTMHYNYYEIKPFLYFEYIEKKICCVTKIGCNISNVLFSPKIDQQCTLFHCSVGIKLRLR
ncbi:MAG: hypothetical protein MJ198_09225 [Bacteroidales bacterium]|nr:hypothetical protein [Bacteroidales bacterium]